MRILIISETTGYMRGGVPEATGQLISGLIAQNHTLGFCGDIVLPGADGAIHFPISLPIDDRLGRDVHEAMRRFRPEVVHVISISSPGLFRLRRQLSDVPWLMTCHSIPPYERKIAGFHGNEAAHYGARAIRYLPHTVAWRWLLSRGAVPHVVVHSPWVRGLVIRYGQPSSETTLIPLGVANGSITPKADQNDRLSGVRLVTVGGIAHTKGLHDAVRAVALLRGRHPNLHYQVIGEVRDASYLRFLQALIVELGLERVVDITPALSTAEKDAALQSADVYLQPSHEEGFCLAYIEAARIVPRLVGTATGAIGLVSEGDELSRVVTPRRPHELAEALASVLAADMPAGFMQRRQARLATDFGWNRYVAAHEALYRSLSDRQPDAASTDGRP